MCLLPLSMSGQCTYTSSTPCSMDSIDLIIILHDSVNNDPVRVNYFMTQLGVRELGMTTPSNARLWRMPMCDSTCIDGESVTWNGTQQAVEQTKPKIKAVGISENWGIVAQPIRYRDGLPPQNLRSLSKCSTNVNYTMLECNRGLEGVQIAVLDAGASMSITAPIYNYIDHFKSWNFIDDTRKYEDKNGHGNFCANIIRTFMSNLDKLHIYKVLDDTGSGNIYDAIEAIDRGSNNEVDLISCSFVAALSSQISTPTTPFSIAIDSAKARNILCLVAAGNDGVSIDYTSYSSLNTQFTDHYTPAAEPNDNIITVGSIGCCANKSVFSNFGKRNVDIFALGEDILSYGLNDVLRTGSGTSFATPQVTGVALLLYSNILQSNRNYKVLKDAILSGVSISASLTGLCYSSGIINAPNAYCNLKSSRPAPCLSTWSTPSCAILAIRELPFTARLNNQTVYLNWSIMHTVEKNTKFIIEKSYNGYKFDQFTHIGADNKKQYSTIDNTLQSGIVYYRLLTLNTNGVNDTSQTIPLSIPFFGQLSVFPNPTKTATTIRYELPVSDKIRIELVDMMGKIHPILLPQFQNKGFNEYSFSAQDFSAGMYECRLIGSRTFLRQKIMITP
jgi:hypothetical protein